MFGFDQVKWGQLLVALPLAHLFTASLYLWGFTSAFGAGIASFVTTGDIFSTTIGELIPVYLLALAVPGMMILGRLAAMSHPNMQAKIDSIKNPRDKRKAIYRQKIYRIALGGAVAVACILFMAIDVHQETRDNLISVYALYGAIALPTIVGARILINTLNNKEIIDTSAATDEIAILVISLFCAAIANGFQKGQDARYAVYAAQRSAELTCGDRVLRKLSDLYLVVQADGHKALASGDCETRLQFPEPT